LSPQQTTEISAASMPAAAGRDQERASSGRGQPAGRVPGPRSTLSLAIALQAVISAGDGLAMVALATRVYQSSHASWAVAVVFLAVCLPVTALAPLAGLMMDRFPARPVLVTAGVAEALVALALSRMSGLAATLVLSVGFGICAAVLQPGLGAIVPRLAGEHGITRANGYLQAATWAGFTVGPLLAGVLTVAGGSSLALVADAVLYALGALGLRMLHLTPRALGETGEGAPKASLSAQMRAGLSFLRADTEAGMLVLIVGAMVLFANLAVVAEVVFAEHVLRSGPGGYSLLVAAWTAGMVIGTLAGGRLPGRWLLAAALAGTLASGLGVAMAGAAAVLWQAMAAYAFGGMANGLEIVATRSLLNHRAPEAVAGRVFALYSGVLFGASSLGMAMAAGLLIPLGARAVLLLAGAGGMLAGLAGCLVHARRRALQRRHRSHSEAITDDAHPGVGRLMPGATKPLTALPQAVQRAAAARADLSRSEPAVTRPGAPGH
jgi:MFS family permease